MQKPNIVIVDQNNEIIGYKKRGTLGVTDFYRVSALWIQNSKGDVLLAQRSFNKRNDPGKWGPAVAGTIDEGETYESNIVKEAEEEIGLVGHPIQKAFIDAPNENRNYFAQWFFAIIDEPIEFFTIQEDEVEQVRWYPREDLEVELKTNPDQFLESIGRCLSIFETYN